MKASLTGGKKLVTEISGTKRRIRGSPFETIDYIDPANYPQPVTSKREVKTTVMVNSGETVVVGGLIKKMESKSVEKVWLPGDIPLLGYLFRHTVIKKEKMT